MTNQRTPRIQSASRPGEEKSANRFESFDSTAARVAERVELLGIHTSAEFAELARLAARFDELTAECPTGVVDRFLAECTTPDERLDRWAVLHTLGSMVPTRLYATIWPGWDPSDPMRGRHQRPLRPLELSGVAVVAKRDQRAANVVFALMGIGSGEAARIGLEDIIDDDDGQPVSVNCPGSGTHQLGPTATAPRVLQIPVWATAIIEKRRAIARHNPHRPFLYDGNCRTHNKIQSSLIIHLKNALRLAGLGGDSTVGPSSLHLGAALRCAEESNVLVAADMLGIADLGLVQQHLGLMARPARRHARDTAVAG